MAASFSTFSARGIRISALLLCSMAAAPALAQDGSVEAGQGKSLTCAACHGPDGNSVTPEWPNLAGQHEAYVVRQLNAYKNGERQDAGMRGFASTLSDQDMQDLAAYFAAQTLRPRGADPSLVSLGQQIYRGGIPERGVAACIACHGPSGLGNPLAAYPRISGQHSTYVYNTLQAYASGARRSDAEMNQMMRNVSELLFEDEMRALASYVQGLR
jgi:cytochrome c553